MENLRYFRVKFLSWARGRNKISNHEPHRLTSPRIEVARPNSLSGLVAELLLSIADSLPPEDTYCLSLCNHRLFSTFESKRSREKLQNNSRFFFLRRLELDNHEYITCYICCALHKYDCVSKGFGLSGPAFQQVSQSQLACARTGGWRFIPGLMMCVHNKKNWYRTHHYHHNKFYFVHLQLAMMRYHYGPRYGISTSALSFTEVKIHMTLTSLLSLEAQICIDFGSPVLCLRIQDIMSVRHLRAYQLVSDQDKQVPPQTYQICAHIVYDELLDSIEEFVDTYCERRTLPLLRTTCNKCNTEYQLELREYGKDNLAYMITRWINLGPGRSPDDPQWKVHSLGSQDVPFTLGLEHMLSSPRVLFEASATMSLDRLSTQNLQYLTDRNYQSVMKQLHDSPPSWALFSEPV
ncbi:hypothetical protein N7449_008748 [Penicillium cf. viridicatum]|uniref:Uncharacterized protein n=1 Tax=Penicillium cf. viridicatum TaxID=2972119 RepID=A0A9W9JB01_9EURO|nr:hypothetical protein N7449_008748 [Penicillium cf. viridicatum]